MLIPDVENPPAARRKDVAERAGVSPAVVSYVLNGGPRRVSPEASERVLKAVRELGYRPNNVARSLRMRRTMTLGLIVPNMANPFVSELVRSVQQEAFKAGYALMVGDSGEDGARQEQYIHSFIERQVDGLILMPAHSQADGFGELEKWNLPWVAIDRYVPGRDDVPSVMVANRDGAYAATSHLLDHGRRVIGCIAGPANVRSAFERAAGWRAALNDRGVRVEDRMELHSVFHRAAGYRDATRLLESRRLDAIFCASDEQALGVLRALKDLGYRCPEDIAIVSFDGIPAGAYVTPGLTTMAQPFAEIGRAGVERLLERIEDPERIAAATVLPVRLVRRGSCGCEEPSDNSYLEIPEATEEPTPAKGPDL